LPAGLLVGGRELCAYERARVCCACGGTSPMSLSWVCRPTLCIWLMDAFTRIWMGSWPWRVYHFVHTFTRSTRPYIKTSAKSPFLHTHTTPRTTHTNGLSAKKSDRLVCHCLCVYVCEQCVVNGSSSCSAQAARSLPDCVTLSWPFSLHCIVRGELWCWTDVLKKSIDTEALDAHTHAHTYIHVTRHHNAP